MLRLVSSLPFHIPEAWKRYPFRPEPFYGVSPHPRGRFTIMQILFRMIMSEHGHLVHSPLANSTQINLRLLLELISNVCSWGVTIVISSADGPIHCNELLPLWFPILFSVLDESTLELRQSCGFTPNCIEIEHNNDAERNPSCSTHLQNYNFHVYLHLIWVASLNSNDLSLIIVFISTIPTMKLFHELIIQIHVSNCMINFLKIVILTLASYSVVIKFILQNNHEYICILLVQLGICICRRWETKRSCAWENILA